MSSSPNPYLLKIQSLIITINLGQNLIVTLQNETCECKPKPDPWMELLIPSRKCFLIHPCKMAGVRWEQWWQGQALTSLLTWLKSWYQTQTDLLNLGPWRWYKSDAQIRNPFINATKQNILKHEDNGHLKSHLRLSNFHQNFTQPPLWFKMYPAVLL